MNAFVVLAAVVACATAHPQLLLANGLGINNLGLYGAPITYGAPIAHQLLSTPIVAQQVIAPIATKTQYHAQDELGQASYGYAHPGQAHAAVRDAFGNVRGSYAYVNPEGKEVRVEYLADAVNGFQVASNDLPVGPAVPAAPELVAPVPVQDTPEVAEAKVAHAKAVADAVARNAEADKADAEKTDAEKPQSRRKRGIIAAPIALSVPTLHVASPAVTYGVVAAPTIVAAQNVRQATLTKGGNNPLHAVSYRVD